jgi:hypothetical protein
MRFGKLILLVVFGFLLGFGNPPASAMQSAGQKALKGEKAAAPRKTRQLSVSAPGKVQPVRRGTEFVKKIEGGFLYTEKGQYSLSGVKVIDLSKTRKEGGPAVSTNKKTAEMTFLNNKLHEIVIRQR